MDGQMDGWYQGVSPGQASLEGTSNVPTLLPTLPSRPPFPPPPRVPTLGPNQSRGEAPQKSPGGGEEPRQAPSPPRRASWPTRSPLPPPPRFASRRQRTVPGEGGRRLRWLPKSGSGNGRANAAPPDGKLPEEPSNDPASFPSGNKGRGDRIAHHE